MSQRQQREQSHRGKRDKFVSSKSIAERLTAEEVDAMIENFAKQDSNRTKTSSRIVVESFLSKFRWYFPQKDKRNGPSLSKAYAYYEHITLPRKIAGEQSTDHVHRRAEPGEVEETELYSAFLTPASCLIEWGTGVYLYFTTVWFIAIVLLCAGLINLPNIIFYSSKAYDPSGRLTASGLPNTLFTLGTSAVCTTGEWVVCTDCTVAQWTAWEAQDRIGTTPNGTILVSRNACNGGQLPQGMVNYATGFFLAGVLLLGSFYMNAREVHSDEDKLTATDYSVMVRNPPKDAYDPDDWHTFFSQFAEKQVTCITIALNNDLLLRTLMRRRYFQDCLLLYLPRSTDFDDEESVRAAVAKLVEEIKFEQKGCFERLLGCTVIPLVNLFNMSLPPEMLVDKLYKLTSEIQELQKKKYEVCSVFVTFETEEGQRAALSALSAGKLDVITNNTTKSAPSGVFKGKILRCEEAAEPTAIRWMDLATPARQKILARLFTFVATLGLIALSGLAVGETRAAYGPAFSGPLVTVFNAVVPQIIKVLMITERHTSEGSFQASLYLKVTLFRWVNTAILAKIITPFTNTVSQGSTDVLAQINAILWAEMWLTPAIRLLDLWGNVQKHLMAPRARTQQLMNRSFQGTFYHLGERYTDLTKVMFVCFFYSALFPAAFFFGFAILVVQYYADKYCLMRIWGWSPALGSELAQFSRRYFFSGSLVAYMLVSAYAWAQFPYDNVCDPDSPTAVTTGIYENVELGDGTTIDALVSQDTAVVFCSQSIRDVPGLPFPPLPDKFQPPGLKWMRGSQELLCVIYGWTCVAVVALFITIFFGAAIMNYLFSWCRGVYEPKGQDQKVDFSSNFEIKAYVPQVKLIGTPFPFLACNVDHIEKTLIGWRDPAHNYDHHNLIYDVNWEGRSRAKILDAATPTTIGDFTETERLRNRPCFSKVKHYPPQWMKDMSAAAEATAAAGADAT